jgi:hypothetical protein
MPVGACAKLSIAEVRSRGSVTVVRVLCARGRPPVPGLGLRLRALIRAPCRDREPCSRASRYGVPPAGSLPRRSPTGAITNRRQLRSEVMSLGTKNRRSRPRRGAPGRGPHGALRHKELGRNTPRTINKKFTSTIELMGNIVPKADPCSSRNDRHVGDANVPLRGSRRGRRAVSPRVRSSGHACVSTWFQKCAPLDS